MKIRDRKGLTFDDVLLVPKRSPVASRGNVDTSTWLTPRIRLKIPMVSANMDTVTETAMAIAMARSGGIGIIHRFMPIAVQAQQVQQVKRAEGFMVEDPYAIAQDAPIQAAAALMKEHDVGGLVVTNGRNKLVGLIT